jgi:MFS family permease
MSESSNKKEFLKQELKEVFKLKPNNRHWSIPVLASLCVGIPMFVGYGMNMFSSALTVSLAGLVILYMPTNSNFVARMAKMLICSFVFLISFGIGIIFSFNPIISCLVFGIFSIIIHWFSLWLKMSPPGNFFFIMLAALASGIPFNLEKIPEKIGLIAIGTILACFLALTYSLIIRKPDIIKETSGMLKEVHFKKDADYAESFIVGFFMFASLLIGHLCGFNKPYWIPISCLAVMQGATAHHIWRRGFYRVLGTALGMGLCWIILSTLKDPLGICIAIVILQFIIESTVTRNYTLAVLFITPLTILLADASNPLAQSPTELITSRLIDVLIGSLIGAIGGWFVYHEKSRHHAVKIIRIIKLVIKKKK